MTTPASGTTYLLLNKATGFALAGALDDEPATTVYADAYTPWDPRQTWLLTAAAGGAVSLGHPATGGALDSNAQRLVYLSKPNTVRSQRWLMRDDGDGHRTVHNVETGLALDSNSDRDIYTMTPSDSATQRWRFVWI